MLYGLKKRKSELIQALRELEKKFPENERGFEQRKKIKRVENHLEAVGRKISAIQKENYLTSLPKNISAGR